MTLSGLEFLAGRMLLENPFLDFLGKDFAFRSGFNQKSKECVDVAINETKNYAKHLQH